MAVAPVLPDIPPKTAAECVDPGVPPISTVAEAEASFAAQRLYAACNKRKFHDVKAFYRTVQTKFSG